MPLTRVDAYAHAKVILMGEHAVVFGYPALALPFPALVVRARLTPVAGPFQLATRYGTSFLHEGPGPVTGLREAIQAAFAQWGRDAIGFRLEVSDGIPPGVGLGSSAAVAVAVIRVLFKAHGHPLPPMTLFELASIAERYAHGTPSGLDVWAVSSDQPLWYEATTPGVSERFPPFTVVVADSGVMSHTVDAVAAVRDRYRASPAQVSRLLERFGRLTHDLRRAMREGHIQEMGRVLDCGHAVLEDLGLGVPAIDRLVRAARRLGADGAKGTGAGLGGSIVALAKDPIHAKELCAGLLTAGARACWVAEVGSVNDFRKGSRGVVEG